MANVPVRDLAAKGILRDPSAYQLDLNAWSNGRNVRFHANKAEAAPIWRTAYDALSDTPVFAAGLEPSTGYDTVTIFGATGRLYAYSNGAVTDVTQVAGFVSSSDPRAVTATFLGDVQYINRPDYPPRYFGPASTHFAALPNQESAWTCRSLRAFGDYLIALNVTKPNPWTDPHTGTVQTGGAFPSLFKWSDLTLIGQTPGSWDYLDPTTSAGENPLEELTTPLVDGLPMRAAFVIYSENDIWCAEPSGDQFIFKFRRLFSTGGLIAPNCAVEVDGIHYCFGPRDIYKHDGVSKVSIVDRRNREAIFRNLNKATSEVCFAAYVPHLGSIFFGYSTGDTGNAATIKMDRCNQAAVYDIANDTWSFVDLPNVSAITVANMDTVMTWATVPATTTWSNIGGSWYDQENTYVKSAVAVSSAFSGVLTNSRLLVYDFMNKGFSAFPYSTEANSAAYVERTGIALDQLGSDLKTYKNARALMPLVNIYDPAVPMQVQIGYSMTPTGAVTWGPNLSFDPNTDYKVDFRTGGRYLALRFTVNSPADWELAGYDIDVSDGGRR